MQAVNGTASAFLSSCKWKYLQVIRISDGFQPHLVSPELGLRKLVHESIEMVLDPVSTAVRRVHQVLLDVARQIPCQLSEGNCQKGIDLQNEVPLSCSPPVR